MNRSAFTAAALAALASFVAPSVHASPADYVLSPAHSGEDEGHKADGHKADGHKGRKAAGHKPDGDAKKHGEKHES